MSNVTVIMACWRISLTSTTMTGFGENSECNFWGYIVEKKLPSFEIVYYWRRILQIIDYCCTNIKSYNTTAGKMDKVQQVKYNLCVFTLLAMWAGTKLWPILTTFFVLLIICPHSLSCHCCTDGTWLSKSFPSFALSQLRIHWEPLKCISIRPECTIVRISCAYFM